MLNQHGSGSELLRQMTFVPRPKRKMFIFDLRMVATYVQREIQQAMDQPIDWHGYPLHGMVECVIATTVNNLGLCYPTQPLTPWYPPQLLELMASISNEIEDMVYAAIQVSPFYPPDYEVDEFFLDSQGVLYVKYEDRRHG